MDDFNPHQDLESETGKSEYSLYEIDKYQRQIARAQRRAELRRNVRAATTEPELQKKRTFVDEKKAWFKGKPEKVSLNQLEITNVGQTQLKELAESKLVSNVVKKQQQNFLGLLKDNE